MCIGVRVETYLKKDWASVGFAMRVMWFVFGVKPLYKFSIPFFGFRFCTLPLPALLDATHAHYQHTLTRTPTLLQLCNIILNGKIDVFSS